MLEQQINDVLSRHNATTALKTELFSVLSNSTNTLDTIDKTIYDSPVNLQSAETWAPQATRTPPKTSHDIPLSYEGKRREKEKDDDDENKYDN